MGPSPSYLVRIQLKEGAADGGEYPFSLPLIRCLDIEFTSPVTFFVWRERDWQVDRHRGDCGSVQTTGVGRRSERTGRQSRP
jgi:hypothetical protein